MASYDLVLEKQQAIEENLLKKLSEFESKFSSTPHTSTSMSRLQEEFQSFKSEVLEILSLLREQISACYKAMEHIEMRHRKKYLLLHGVKEGKDDSLTDYIVKLFKEKLGLKEFRKGDLSVCHRLGKTTEGKSRPILMRFSDSSLRSSIWKKKVGLKGTSVVMSEFLTRQRQTLFLAARKRLGQRSCWTSDGVIFVKTPDGSIHRISSEEDLVNLPEATETQPEESENQTNQKSRSPSPVATDTSEPASKNKRAARQRK